MGVRTVIAGDARLRRLSKKILFAVRPGARRWYLKVNDAFQEARWQEVIDLIEAGIRARRSYLSPGVYTKLAQSYTHLGAYDMAATALARGTRTYANSVPMARAQAELAMVMKDWPAAALAWTAFDKRQDPKGVRMGSFPLRGSDFTWFEQTWAEFAEHWPTPSAGAVGDQEADRQPSPQAMVRTVETLRTTGAHEVALALGERALDAYPHEHHVVARVCETIIRIREFDSVDQAVDTLEKDYPHAAVREYCERMRTAAPALNDLLNKERLSGDEIRVLSVARNSGLAGAIFASQPWTDRRIHDEAMRLSRRDRWPEGSSPKDLLSTAAWHQARRFARGRGSALGIDDDDIARALFHNLKHELVLKVPIERIADEVARTHDGGPIFVHLSSLKFTYLVAYPQSAFGQIYLYEALRKRGLPVYLVRFPGVVKMGAHVKGVDGLTGPRLVARSTGAGLRPHERTLERQPAQTTNLVVTSGIRSIATLLDRTGEAVVLNSGAPLKPYAYDRSFRQSWDYAVHDSVHPKWQFPRMTFETTTRAMWLAGEAAPVVSEPVAGAAPVMTLATGPRPEGSWHELLGNAVMPYFEYMVTRARKLVEARGITDVHIGDYLYTDPSLVAAVAAKAGARVHVWPHSANPVHVKFHAHDRLATVRAVTRSGVKAWEEYATSARVVHDPSLVVRETTKNVEWSTDEPVSLVLIGGRSVMRNMPVLDLETHEQLYRDLFAELEPLVAQGKVRVYFKPRGLTGEHEGWLESVVGNAASWQPVLGHPLRIDLPNPVFASVSVASTALIEGISRGIPGFVVREGAARDYLALEPGSLQVLSLAQAVEWMQSHVDENSWQAWRTTQTTWLARELTPAGEG